VGDDLEARMSVLGPHVFDGVPLVRSAAGRRFRCGPRSAGWRHTLSLVAVNGLVWSNYLALSGLPLQLGTLNDLQ